MKTMNNLYNWLFHYNPHTSLWAAYSREDHTGYWNGTIKKDNVYYHADFQELVKILNTTKCL